MGQSIPDAESHSVPITVNAIDDAISRTVAIAGLAGVALIHVLQLPGAGRSAGA